MTVASFIALVEFDTFTRFKAMAAVGNLQAGLSILEKLGALTNRVEKP
jgi:hypothetical protein